MRVYQVLLSDDSKDVRFRGTWPASKVIRPSSRRSAPASACASSGRRHQGCDRHHARRSPVFREPSPVPAGHPANGAAPPRRPAPDQGRLSATRPPTWTTMPSPAASAAAHGRDSDERRCPDPPTPGRPRAGRAWMPTTARSPTPWPSSSMAKASAGAPRICLRRRCRQDTCGSPWPHARARGLSWCCSWTARTA